jgi:hypothetical protein
MEDYSGRQDRDQGVSDDPCKDSNRIVLVNAERGAARRICARKREAASWQSRRRDGMGMSIFRMGWTVRGARDTELDMLLLAPVCMNRRWMLGIS